jgi:hypothetical protein
MRGIQNAAIRDLKLNGNPFTWFDGLLRLPNLEILRLDNSQLAPVNGAVEQPRLYELTYLNTPLSLYELHQEMAIIVFGTGLRSVNNRKASRLRHECPYQSRSRPSIPHRRLGSHRLTPHRLIPSDGQDSQANFRRRSRNGRRPDPAPQIPIVDPNKEASDQG